MNDRILFLVITLFLISGCVVPPSSDAKAPYGLEAMQRFERLPYLKTGTAAGQMSSYDRTGANRDGFGTASNYLYSDGDENVIAELNGPGCIYRMWFTGFRANNAYLKIFIDGESTPRLNMLLKDIFSGDNAPFLRPLVADNNDSSGGFVAYLPIPFAKSIKIVTNGTGLSFFYSVGYQLFSPDTEIISWSKQEDSDAVRAMWNRAGKDPKNDEGNSIETGAVNLAPSEVRTLVELTGQRSISSIKLRVPGVANERHGEVTDDGRAHRGNSQFRVAIDPDNSGVLLKRRLNYGIANQSAEVFVDGQSAGQWQTAGSDTQNQWRDSGFAIPPALTAGKRSITVRVKYKSPAGNWTEYRYWVYCNGYLTDEVDPGSAVSESQHEYAISSQRVCGDGNFTYPPADSGVQDILNNTWIRIYWDNEPEASIDAPIGAFFGMGQFGNYAVHALPFGIDANDTLYIYFPMPFQNRARVELYSNRSEPVNGIEYEIRHKAFADAFAEVGYFKTSFRHEAASTPDADLMILETQGKGHFVGVVESLEGNPGRAFLEGDERIYVDDSRTPVVHGTGTEDFYNGGWYFSKGLFSRPMHGYTGHATTERSDKTAMYRFLTHDAVPFQKNIKVSIEHGPTNNQEVASWILAFYYHQPEAAAKLTDTFDVGDNASERVHDYSVSGEEWNGSLTSSYIGDNHTVPITEDGRGHTGASEFTMSVDPENSGVILRRMYNHAICNQKADLFVDGGYVGQWFNAGCNDTLKWEDSDIMIPASFTSGKSLIRIKLEFISSAGDWNEFLYSVYCLK